MRARLRLRVAGEEQRAPGHQRPHVTRRERQDLGHAARQVALPRGARCQTLGLAALAHGAHVQTQVTPRAR